MTELQMLTASQARVLLSQRDISAAELLEACLDRIAEREPLVRAWAHIDPDAAKARARRLDTLSEQGPLHGIPIGVKDIIDTAAMPTAWGSKSFAGRRPGRDAPCVTRLEAAGAIILGKNVTTEFAYFSPGPTRNPRDLTRTPGGSSSGSAAAVADCMVPLSIGTQAAGSTIRPASFCGVPAFKPSHGRWNMEGALRLYPTVDTLSVFARDFADAALVDDILGPVAPPAPKPPARVLVFIPAEWDRAGEASREALASARRLVDAAGVPVQEIRATSPFDQLVSASDIIVHVEAAKHSGAIVDEAESEISAIFLALIEKGRGISDKTYADALAIRDRARQLWPAMVGPDTLVLTPAVPGEAPEGLNSTGDPVFIRTWNVVGAPTANLPLYQGPLGLPVGVQAVGVPGRDRELLAGAGWMMDLAKRERSR